LSVLREGILEAYTGIITAFKGTDQGMPSGRLTKRVTHSVLVRLLQPHIQDILELVKAALLDDNHGDPVYGLAYGIIGDLADIFGAQIKPLLLQDWVAAELKSRRCPPENKQTMRWAREVGRFETIRVLLDDYFCLDGQTCHGLSIVFQFFSLTSQGLSLLPYHTYFTGPTFEIMKLLSTLGPLYLLPCALFVDGLPSGGVSSSIPLLRPGSTLFLTSSVRFSSLLLLFWFESLLSIITVSFEFQSSPSPLHCHIMQSFSPCQAIIANGGFPIISSSPARLLRRDIPALFSNWVAIYPSPVLEGIPGSIIPISRLLSVSLAYPYILPRYLCFAHQPLLVISSKSHQRLRKTSRSFLEERVKYSSHFVIRTNVLRPHCDARESVCTG